METAYLHLITNHIPIIGVPFALVVLVIGIWRNNEEIKGLGFLIFTFLGLATIGVFLLGQGGEDFVEELSGVSHDAIEDHEGVAKFALASVLVIAAISLFAFVRYGGLGMLRPRFRKSVDDRDAVVPEKRFPMWIVLTVVVLGLVSAAVLGYTGRLGGKIRHPEFHQESTATSEGEVNETEEENGKGRGRNRGRR